MYEYVYEYGKSRQIPHSYTYSYTRISPFFNVGTLLIVMPFEFQQGKLPGVVLVTPAFFADSRGRFAETYRRSAFLEGGIDVSFVQDNLVDSGPGVLRGLHYQKNPVAQAKLVRVSSGSIFDVAVDLRPGSPTYAQWEAYTLSAENGLMLFIPAGCAHGYAVLTEAATVAYKVTAEYSPGHDRGIRWDDPEIGVEWPFADPVLSPKDVDLPLLADADNNFVWEEVKQVG